MAQFIGSDNIHVLPYHAVTCRRSSLAGSSLDTQAFSVLNNGASATALPNYPTGEALEVVGGANDTSGGTGLRTLRVIYLVGTTGTISSEVITMHASAGTAVPLVQTSVTRVIGMHGVTFGTNAAVTTSVTIQVASGGATRMSISPMFRSAFPGRYTVPDGYTAFYRGFSLNHTGGTATLPATIEYLIRADLASQTGLLSTNNFIDLDFDCSNIGTGPTGSGRPTGVNGQNIVLPPGTTISALARHEGSGAITIGGRFFLELVSQVV